MRSRLEARDGWPFLSESIEIQTLLSVTEAGARNKLLNTP